MEPTLRLLQMVRAAMLGSIVLYAAIAAMLPSSAAPNPVFFYAIALLSVAEVAVLLVMRRTLVLPAEAAVAAQPADARALAQWRTGYLVTYCVSESIALYGVVLHFLGFPFSLVAPFYLAGFILLVFFAPRRPSNTIG